MFFNFRSFRRHFLQCNIGRLNYRQHDNWPPCGLSVSRQNLRASVRAKAVHRRNTPGLMRWCLCAGAADKTYAVMGERRRSTVRGAAEGRLRRWPAARRTDRLRRRPAAVGRAWDFARSHHAPEASTQCVDVVQHLLPQLDLALQREFSRIARCTCLEPSTGRAETGNSRG